MPKKIYNISTRLKSEIVINYNLEDKFSNAAAHITSSHDSLTDPIGYAKICKKYPYYEHSTNTLNIWKTIKPKITTIHSNKYETEIN